MRAKETCGSNPTFEVPITPGRKRINLGTARGMLFASWGLGSCVEVSAAGYPEVIRPPRASWCRRVQLRRYRRPIQIGEASLVRPGFDFACMVLPLEDPGIMVNGTKDPVVGVGFRS